MLLLLIYINSQFHSHFSYSSKILSILKLIHYHRMQGLRPYYSHANGGIRLDLTPATTSLTLDVEESTTEHKIQLLISENPVVIFSRRSCCMCLVIKTLLSSVGAKSTIMEMDEDEIFTLSSAAGGPTIFGGAPVVFVGGVWIGGLENLVALHLSGRLISKLVEAGAT